MHKDGEGVKQDYTTAADLFKLSADQGDAGAQTRLSIMYDTGRGVSQDKKMAFDLFKISGDKDMQEPNLILDVITEMLSQLK